MRSKVVGISLALIVFGPLVATPAGRVAGRENAVAAARTLANDIVQGTIPVANAATKQALSWGGIATADNLEHVYIEHRGQQAAVLVSPLEALNLSVEAREREATGRMSLDELGRMLADFGFPFLEGGAAPGEQLVGLLKVWIAQARKRASDFTSFTPLFLAQMAKRQNPPVNLAKGSYAPEALLLTTLEVELFVAAFLRAEIEGVFPPPAPSEATVEGDGSTPCTDFKTAQSKQILLGGDIIGAQVSWGAGKGLEKAVEHMTKSPASADKVGKMMSAANIAAKIQKVMAIYGSAVIRVFTKENDAVHKPLDKANVDSDLLQHFDAIAGLTDADWQAFQTETQALGEEAAKLAKAAKDCFGFIGLPTLTDLGDLQGNLTKWVVRWELSTNPTHAVLNNTESNFTAGLLKHYLTPVNDHEGFAEMAVDVKPERDDDHTRRRYTDSCARGSCKTSSVTATAELDTSEPPSLQTFIDAAQGGLGLASSVLELAAGWLQSTAGPKSSATLDVTYHAPECGSRASVAATARQGRSVDRADTCGPQTWSGQVKIEFTRTESGPNNYSGRIEETIDVNLNLVTDSEGHLPVDSTYSVSASDVSHGGPDSNGCSGAYEAHRAGSGDVDRYDIRLIYNPELPVYNLPRLKMSFPASGSQRLQLWGPPDRCEQLDITSDWSFPLQLACPYPGGDGLEDHSHYVGQAVEGPGGVTLEFHCSEDFTYAGGQAHVEINGSLVEGRRP